MRRRISIIHLSDEQKDAVGLIFIMDKLQGDSPYGEKMIRDATFFKREQKKELLDEFNNISAVLALESDTENQLDTLRRALMAFKNIENSLTKLENTYLHEIELFEIKSFLLNLIRVQKAYESLCLKLKNVEFIDMEEALDILDPDKKRLAPFYLNERYTEELWQVRNEKNRIEALMREENYVGHLDKLKIERAEIVAREEAAEIAVKKDLSKKLRHYLPVFRKNINSIGRLDFTIQKALLAAKYGAACPEIGECDFLQFSGMKNPAVEAVLCARGRSFTVLDIELKSGTTLLTGANMGGKSVAVKTAVLNICLFQMGFFVFAKSAVIPMFDGIYMIAEDMQSLNSGLSTFAAEIMRFNHIIQKANSEYLFVALDEFARGTNPEEGALIVRAVSKYLNTLKSVSILTTHYDNVAAGDFGLYQVAGLQSVNFENLQEEILRKKGSADSVDLIAEHMDYRLLKVKEALKPPRDALNICRLLGTEQSILSAIESEYEEIT